ncbi:MAG: prepilin peptidase [Candidatus Dependentiae bacterium]
MVSVLWLFPLFLCWGSFLNVVGYRIIRGLSVVAPRSYCPHCRKTIYWYDNIPVISWLKLNGVCRHCKKPISFLYPFIELITALSLTTVALLVPHHYFLSFFIFFSALIVTTRTDLEKMLISRFMTLFLVPLGIGFASFGLLPIDLLDSLIGALAGYGLLWLTKTIFYRFKGQEGLGQGDLDLLCFIGSFTGLFGIWFSLLIGSVTGSIVGIVYLITHKKTREVKIPFGPFLALGAMSYVLLSPYLLLLFSSY